MSSSYCHNVYVLSGHAWPMEMHCPYCKKACPAGIEKKQFDELTTGPGDHLVRCTFCSRIFGFKAEYIPHLTVIEFSGEGLTDE